MEESVLTSKNKVVESSFGKSFNKTATSQVEQTLVDYMVSDRDTTSSNFSVGNLAAVLAPQQSGKSYLIKKALLGFEGKVPKDKKVIVHIDLSSYGNMNFDQFHQLFEGSIISQLAAQIKQGVGVEAIKSILDASFDKKYLSWMTLRLLERLVNDTGRLQLPLEYRSLICDKGKSCTLEEIVTAVKDGLKIGEIEAWLEVVRDLCLDSEVIDTQREDLSVSGLKVA